MRAQSVSAGVRARAWHAAIAACSAYGPRAPPSSSARSSAARPRRIEQLIPARAVLIEQQDRLARRADPRARARRLDLHQRDEAVDLRLLRGELGQDAAEAQRVLAERGPHPVVAGGRRVALVEDEVDDLEHRRQARARAPRRAGPRTGTRASASVRLARTMRWAMVGSGTRNARAISSVVRPPSRRSVSATRASVERTGWQAVKIEAQEVVADVVVERGVEVRRGHLLPRLELAAELLVLALEQRAPAQHGRSRGASRWP